MSRYNFADQQGQSWAVGYDPSVASYFAQINKHHDAITVVGEAYGEVRSVDALKELISDQVQVPKMIEKVLRANGPAAVSDRRARTARTRVKAMRAQIIAAADEGLDRI